MSINKDSLEKRFRDVLTDQKREREKEKLAQDAVDVKKRVNESFSGAEELGRKDNKK